MAAGTNILLKRKAGAFAGGNLAAGELGVDTTNGVVYGSKDGSTVFALLSANFVLLEEQQTSGTHGGTFSNGADRTRLINTKVSDINSLCTYASNQFTFAAGTWIIRGEAVSYLVKENKLKLYNVTGSTVLANGLSGRASSTDTTSGISTVEWVGTLAASQALELRHWCDTTGTTTGFGIASSAGGVEVYSRILAQKIG